MALTLLRVLLLVVPLVLTGCGGSDDIPEGGQCQFCRSADPRCNPGMTCQRFESNFLYSLCATPGTKSCPVPF